jgi:hypothetical protein
MDNEVLLAVNKVRQLAADAAHRVEHIVLAGQTETGYVEQKPAVRSHVNNSLF